MWSHWIRTISRRREVLWNVLLLGLCEVGLMLIVVWKHL